MRAEGAHTRIRLLAVAAVASAAIATASCSTEILGPSQRTFRNPEDAVLALTDAAAKRDTAGLMAMFGRQGETLIDRDPGTSRRNLGVFSAAVREGWRLLDQNGGKTLLVGNEGWPFPVPLVREADGWRFDSAKGREEVLTRRIGRNELAAIRVCRTYVAAQRLYARQGHDGKPAGRYATAFRSDPGRQNGLYWPAARGETRSPLGNLITEAAAHSSSGSNRRPVPFHGYFYRILTAQGRAARGGPIDYVVGGEMSRGFALVAWPAEYDSTGVMTFIVNHDDVVYEKDLGTGTDAAVRRITLYQPDASWAVVE